MANLSSSSDNSDRNRKRYYGWILFLALAIVVIAFWLLRSSGSRPAEAEATSQADVPAGAQKLEPAVAAGKTAAASATASAPGKAATALTPPVLVFDSNKVSGRVLISKGRDNKFIPDSDAASGWSLWVRDAAGVERLVHESVYSAKFSPDGQRVAYTTSGVELRVEDLQGNKLVEVLGGYSPQWKPDGSAIVFAKVPEGRDLHLPGAFHLATLDPASGQVNLLTDGQFDDGRPEYAPTGDWILFVSGARNGFASFWKVNTQGGEPVQVTNIGQRAVDETFVPTPYRKTLWSPDGRWFVYDFKSGDRQQIWGLEFGANGELVRSAKIADGLDPSWAEDGKSFVYSKVVNGQTEPARAVLP